MNDESIQFNIPEGQTVSGIRTTPDAGSASWLFVYAPGAGSNLNDSFGRYACRELAERGVASCRFEFPYMQARRRAPDRPPVLEATWREVIGNLRSDGVKLVIGGRSMGGRTASQVVAQGEQVDGLVLFAYPLHPPGRSSDWRDKHFPAITVPTLFCSGTRDAFGSPEELTTAAGLISGSRVHFLEGADHGFNVPKSSGRTREDVWNEAVSVMADWLQGLDSS